MIEIKVPAAGILLNCVADAPNAIERATNDETPIFFIENSTKPLPKAVPTFSCCGILWLAEIFACARSTIVKNVLLWRERNEIIRQ